MTHAELLRRHANLAIKEGGMYYSGEYLSRIAATAESLEAENAKLRKLLGKYHYTLLAFQDDEREEGNCSPCPLYVCPDTTMCPWDNAPCPFVEAINELGIEDE